MKSGVVCLQPYSTLPSSHNIPGIGYGCIGVIFLWIGKSQVLTVKTWFQICCLFGSACMLGKIFLVFFYRYILWNAFNRMDIFKELYWLLDENIWLSLNLILFSSKLGTILIKFQVWMYYFALLLLLFFVERSYYEIELLDVTTSSHSPSLIICLVSCGAHLSAPSSALYYEVLKFTINTQGIINSTH